MRLIYIYHSGFIIEGKEFAILIDYYRDTPESYVYRHFLKRPGRLYILSSHAHPDHFNPEILSWKSERPDIRYILSEDIRDSQKACFHDAIFLKKGEEWNDDLLKIEAFGSTDIGISFLLDVADKRIFHAGDLNNWHWEDESTPAEIREAANFYHQELETLARETDYVDLALFPVDPRLGKVTPGEPGNLSTGSIPCNSLLCTFGKNMKKRMLSGNMSKSVAEDFWRSENQEKKKR